MSSGVRGRWQKRNMNNDNAASFVKILFNGNAMVQHLMKLILDVTRFFECLSADDAAGTFIRHA